jgi:23S rRNA-/tRNA-specific pseudouridylate synthase
MAPRLLLHAVRLTLDHPQTGERMTWRSACPF